MRAKFSPLWVFAVDHETAAVGQLMNCLGVVFQRLLQALVFLEHY